MAPTHQATRPTSIPRVLVQHIANTVTRLSIAALKIFIVAIMMFLIPRMIHNVVRDFDILQEITGRRARSPFEPHVRWRGGAMVALALLIFWHEVLRRLSYRIVSKGNDDGDAVVTNAGQEKKRALLNVSWGKILGMIIIPGLLMVFLVLLVWRVVRHGDARELITANTVGPVDGKVAGLMQRDL